MSAPGHSRRFGRTSIISGLPPRADMWTNAGAGELGDARCPLSTQFRETILFSCNLPKIVLGAFWDPGRRGRRVGAGLSSMGGGLAKFRSSFPGPSMGERDQRFLRSRRSGRHRPGGFSHSTTRKGWGQSQSASRAQCVWRGTGAERSPRRSTMSAAGSDTA